MVVPHRSQGTRAEGHLDESVEMQTLRQAVYLKIILLGNLETSFWNGAKGPLRALLVSKKWGEHSCLPLRIVVLCQQKHLTVRVRESCSSERQSHA
jgi:hypothetical protein